METSEVVAAHALDRAFEIQRIEVGKDGGTVDKVKLFKDAKEIAEFMSEAGEYARKRDEESQMLQEQIDGLQQQIIDMAQNTKESKQ